MSHSSGRNDTHTYIDNSTGVDMWYTQLQTVPSIEIFSTMGFVAAAGSSPVLVINDPSNSKVTGKNNDDTYNYIKIST